MEDKETTADVLQALATQKDLELDKVAWVAIADAELLREIRKGIVSKDDTYRYNCFKVLLQISESHSHLLYPEWDYFVELLSSDNSYHRSASVNIMANLASADAENRFEGVFDQYFDLLDDKSMIAARYVARNAGKIARSKPHLQRRITASLLDIDKTHHEPGRRDLIKHDIIQSFEEFFDASDDKETILAFVEEQLECSSPKTSKAAKAFLKQHG